MIQFLIGVLLISCNNSEPPGIQTGGPEVIEFRVLPFELTEVELLDGPFKHATELNVKSLLNYEPDRLLAGFRSEAGLEPRAEHYLGWENETLAGHSLGHHLSGCALMYQTTGDQTFLDRVNYIVDELKICQDANGDGYIGAFPDGKRVFEEEIAKGDIRPKLFDLNGIWAPYYTMHKVMAGLRDAYTLCGNHKALEIEKKFADWVGTIVNPLTDEEIQEMLDCEHGGMNEVLADLYAHTGDGKYLELSRVFHHNDVLEPLSQGEDILPGIHGNTQIPKLIGLARRYELTGDENDRKTAEYFWDRVVHHHSYVTGGHGNHEYFGEPDKLRNRLSDETTESCNVYNMLKLSRHMFQWEASAEVADFYERALFNHILSSQHPGDGRVIYNLSLEMGGFKTYQDPYWFTCCVGTGMENHSKYGRNIFFHNDKELFVSQFIASEVEWAEKGLVVRQLTNFPQEQGTTIEFDSEKPVKLVLQLRYPYWAENGMEIVVNGKQHPVKRKPGSFVAVAGEWKTGDRVEVKIPFSLRLETMPDDTNRIAVMYGPLVLAGDLGEEDDPHAREDNFVPVIMTEQRDPVAWTNPEPGSNVFRTAGVGNPRDFVLQPFYSTHERRYSVYWDMYNEESWADFLAAKREKLEKKQKIIDQSLDFIFPGDSIGELAHQLKGENTIKVLFRHRTYRQARRGWFSYDMKVLKDQPMGLAVEYWGGFTGSKSFDISIDGELLVTEDIVGIMDGEFVDVVYEIPVGLTTGKSKVTVKFEAHPFNIAGPLFEIRTIVLESCERIPRSLLRG